jgi:hypothetical protein
MRCGLELHKGGKLVETYWVYDETKGDGDMCEKDVTENAIRLLFEPCDLAQDITLKDIFLLLNTELKIFDAVLGNWCEEFVKEGLSGEGKPYTGEYNPEEIEYLQLSKYMWIDSDLSYGLERPDFGGVGFELKEEWDGWSKGDRISYGISFSPTQDLINLPVKLDRTLIIYNENPASGRYHETIAEYENITFTLGDILNGIIWEISFNGGPEKKADFKQQLLNYVDEIKKSLDSNS